MARRVSSFLHHLAPANTEGGTGTSIDKAALRKKYAEERDKRLRDDGNDQYLTLDGNLSYYKSDPYVNLEDREPKTDHTLFTYVGGGFAGLCAGAGLVQSGIDPKDIRIVEKGGDVGGTWYWNRYPGAMCDTAALIYMPLLEETGHMPTEKYAHGPEILEQSQKIASKHGLYQNALLHTEVTSLTWEDELSHWRIRTSRGDNFTSKYLGVGTGPFVVPKLPGIPGIGSFKGHTFHTSRWDYEYTGGSAVHGGELSEAGGGSKVAHPLDKLSDKRVAIIGTGATAVQCVPHLAAACKELYVFQRTPSSVDVRGNKPTDPDWFKTINAPGWQQRWQENFVGINTGRAAPGEKDLVQDGWTDLSIRILRAIKDIPRDQVSGLQV
jgi:cyclohexanone monooxygenase